MSKEQLYKNIDALKPIEKLLTEAHAAVADPFRTFSEDSEINAVLAAAGGIIGGGGIGFAALFYGGSVVGLSAAGITSGLAAAGAIIGGGMAVGIGVLAAPAVVLGIGGYALVDHHNKQKLVEKKEMLLQEVLRKHSAVIAELNKTSQYNQERIDYLTRLNTLLQEAMRDLQSDLKASAA